MPTLAIYLDNRYLSAGDSEFVQFVTSDIAHFLAEQNLHRVLLFPPIDNYHRLLIHRTVEEFPALCSFSVGEGDSRRTVVCLQALVLRAIQSEKTQSCDISDSVQKVRRTVAMNQPSWGHFGYHDSSHGTPNTQQSHGKSRTPTSWEDTYIPDSSCRGQGVGDEGKPPVPQRPSSARTRREEAAKGRGRARRPEMQLYVPRARRLQQDGSPEPVVGQEPSPSRHHHPQDSPSSSPRPGSRTRRTKREAQNIYVPRARRQQLETTASEHAHQSDQSEERSNQVIQSGSPTEEQHHQAELPRERSKDKGDQTSPQKTRKKKRRSSEGHGSDKEQAQSRTRSNDRKQREDKERSGHRRQRRPSKDRPKNNDSKPADEAISGKNEEPRQVDNAYKAETQQISEGTSPVVMERNQESHLPNPEAEVTNVQNAADDIVSASCTKYNQDHEEGEIVDNTSGLISDKTEMQISNNFKDIAFNIDNKGAISNSMSDSYAAFTFSETCIESSMSGHEGVQLESNSDMNAEESTNMTADLERAKLDAKRGDLLTVENEKPSLTELGNEGGKLTTMAESALSSESEASSWTTAREPSEDKDLKALSLDKQEEASQPEDTNIGSWAMAVDQEEAEAKQQTEANNFLLNSQPIPQIVESAFLGSADTKVAMVTEPTVPSVGDDIAGNEESWENMFDDDGEALDPKILEELTVAVGNVKVEKPQFDYYGYQPQEPELDYGEYGHLIEIYDFSPNLITRDILVAFREYSDKGFDVKWVDDTHAIGIFASNIAAHSALSLKHPLLKVRALSQATRQTKLKAKKCTEFLQPYKARPETTASVARSLVAGALGLQSQVDRRKSHEDRQKLKEAREKRRAEKRQKKDAWEGSIGRCAMDEES